MYICGFQKTTLLDYPEHVAATIFLGGCNFRCPFCYNGDLVLHPQTTVHFTRDEILAYLKKRKGILQGVCITGGEPTLSPELPSFLREIKEMGYLIKLDTNGSRPDVLKMLCEKNLVNYVAMDIKSGLSDYLSVIGFSGENVTFFEADAALSEGAACKTASEMITATTPEVAAVEACAPSAACLSLQRPDTVTDCITESVHYLINEASANLFQYEFRTTVVKPLHMTQSFFEIAQLIHGADRYYIQSFSNNKPLSTKAASAFDAYTKQELEHFAAIVRPHVAHVSLRGVE